MTNYAFNQASVLLVDDSVWMRLILINILKAVGFVHIHEAVNGTAALTLIDTLWPDIVLTDWEMQPMDGLELTRRIRRLSGKVRFTPIVMISAHSFLGNVLAARNAGVTEYLVKPVSLNALYQRIVAVVEHPRSFVEAPGYVGPDRRRHTSAAYHGPQRRELDRHADGERTMTGTDMQTSLTQDEVSTIMAGGWTPRAVAG